MPTNTATQPLQLHALGMLCDPSYVEHQEAQGQHEVSNAGKNFDRARIVQLPTTKDAKIRQQYEALGFVFGEPVNGDPIFSFVTIPAGWSIEPTSHNMHNDIVDEQGRRRDSFFYKAAFYDRDAILYSATNRYRVEEYSLDVRDTYERCALQRYRILDRVLAAPIEKELNETREQVYRLRGKPAEQAMVERVASLRERLQTTALFTYQLTVELPRPVESPSTDEEIRDHRAWWDLQMAQSEQAAAVCTTWLDEHFPEHKSPAAYW
jgi:hypothetical protein